MSDQAPSVPLVGVVILNWNGWRDTLEAVASVRRSSDARLRIYIVDNDSSDGSEAELRSREAALTVIQSGANRGWAGGNNVGIRAALAGGCEHVLLLNNDATVRPDAIAALLDAAQALPDAACLGSLIVRMGDPAWVEFGGSFVEASTGLPAQISGRAAELNLPREPQRMVAVKGCSMMLTATGLARVGLLDEDYFLNFDETDWCYRAARVGLASYLVPLSIVEHKGAVSFGGTQGPLYRYFITRNRLVFARRHLGRRARWHAWKSAFWELRQAFSQARGRAWPQPGARALAQAVLLAVADHLRGRLGDCPQRVRWLNERFPGRP